VFDTVLGLPLHALIVHGVVVVVPLVAVAAVVVAAYGPWRRRLALPLAALALGSTALAWVATESGEALNQRLGLPDVARRHTELGDSLPIFVFLLTVALVVLGVLARRQRAANALVAVGVVMVLVTAGLLTWRAVLVGHSGSAAVWGPIVENTQAPAG
jgi:hypothetical protein